LGIALSRPEQEVVCIDGDGSLLMHLGSITALVDFKPKNLKYILINNNVHESVGGQRTVASELNIFNIVSSISKNDCIVANTTDDLKKLLPDFMDKKELSFLEINVYPGSRDDLGRPTIKPIENKANLMKVIEKNAEKS
jgi:phosphonopyruvate decarboxylase